ncbi:MAG: DUF1887 family CARF protein [Thermoplasmata archaeon]
MKILLSLLSEQQVANLLVVHAVKPEKLLLVETKGMKEKNSSANFLNALKIGGLDYLEKNKHEILEITRENSMKEIEGKIKECYERYEKNISNEWIINLTGGTKPMVLGTYNFFKDKNAKMLYLAAANQKEIVNLLEDKKEMEILHKTSIKEFLAGYGYEAKDEEKTWEKKEKEWFELSKYIVTNLKEVSVFLNTFFRKCSELKEKNHKDPQQHGVELEELGDDDGLKMPTGKFGEYLEKMFRVKIKENPCSGRLDKYMVQFLTGKWLEVFLYHILSEYKDKLEIWDLHIELRIFQKKDKLENELDIAFMKDQMLHIIECKTGVQSHDEKEVTALYKIEAIKKQFGALKVKSIFATTSDNILDRDKKKIKEHIQNRARIYDCTLITRVDIKELAEKYEMVTAKQVTPDEYVDLLCKKFGLKKRDIAEKETKPECVMI